MIKRLLIANRGEIAVRIIRSCREMGIKTVAVYSEMDKDSLHVRLADRSVCIGPAPPAKSYLVKENLIMAALHTDCEAIHPGVGFLSESAKFAHMVRNQGLIFIGPDPEVIELLGDKIRARATAQKYGLQVTPGTGVITGETMEAAEVLGFPVIIKAAAGGGGKGMRIVRRAEDLADNISIASREAEVNFADGTVFIEKYLENPRHVELQILADDAQVAVLGERDCTIQKNHQKLIEESPSPAVDPGMRRAMAAGAVPLFRELEYRGAGTIEFLVEDGKFYFMEVNARVQVEHPVSEFVSGIDIIRQQILACTEGRMELSGQRDAAEAGKSSALSAETPLSAELPLSAKTPLSVELPLSGWAVECRINALAPGKITRLEVPGGPGVRFDSFLYPGYSVPAYYDSMVAKLIVHGADRNHALARMDRALRELVIDGIATNKERQRWIINHPVFHCGAFGASWYGNIEKEVEHVR
jgi:acetyl-CoA carboxylase biotin carboxylase subunit